MRKKILFTVLMFIVVLFANKLCAQPTVNMVSVQATNYYSALMTGVVANAGGWTINGVGFIWDTLPMPTRHNGAKSKQAANSCTVNTNFSTSPSAVNQYMASGKTYYVRAYAKKGSGTSVDTVFSDTMSVYIPECEAPSFHLDTTTNIGLYNATMHATITAINDVSTISKKGIVYSNVYTDPKLGHGTALFNTAAISNYPFSWSESLTTLQPGVTYYARAVMIVKYMNSGLDTLYSNVIPFSTLRACGVAPYDVTIDNITTTSAVVKFTPGEGQVRWQLDYGFAGHTPGTGVSQLIDEDSMQINNLIGGRSYSLFVRAVCDTEYSEWSVIQTFTTIAPPCAPVTNIYVTNVEDTYAKVSWMPGAMSQTKWEVCFAKLTDQFADHGTEINNTPVFTPIGLVPQQRYKLRIRAVCLIGTETLYSDWSDDYSFITKPASIDSVNGEEIQKVTIYPNPTDGTINFKVNNPNTISKIEIWNSLGEKIYTSNTLPQSYALDKQTKGLFLVKIFIGTYVQVEKVILN